MPVGEAVEGVSAAGKAEAAELLANNFYSESQARSLPIGTVLMVADVNGRWAEAKVAAHGKDELRVTWVDFPRFKHYDIPYSDQHALSHASSPSEGHHPLLHVTDIVTDVCFCSV